MFSDRLNYFFRLMLSAFSFASMQAAIFNAFHMACNISAFYFLGIYFINAEDYVFFDLQESNWILLVFTFLLFSFSSLSQSAYRKKIVEIKELCDKEKEEKVVQFGDSFSSSFFAKKVSTSQKRISTGRYYLSYLSVPSFFTGLAISLVLSFIDYRVAMFCVLSYFLSIIILSLSVFTFSYSKKEKITDTKVSSLIVVSCFFINILPLSVYFSNLDVNGVDVPAIVIIILIIRVQFGAFRSYLLGLSRSLDQLKELFYIDKSIVNEVFGMEKKVIFMERGGENHSKVNNYISQLCFIEGSQISVKKMAIDGNEFDVICLLGVCFIFDNLFVGLTKSKWNKFLRESLLVDFDNVFVLFPIRKHMLIYNNENIALMSESNEKCL